MIDTAFLAEAFHYLDELRESGVTNMYGAGSYLQDEFDLSRRDASKVLGAWMETFGDGTADPRTRAEAANKEAV